MQHWNPIPPNLLYFPPKIFISKNQSIVQTNKMYPYISHCVIKMLIHIIFHSLKSVIGEKSQCKKHRISCSKADNDM